MTKDSYLIFEKYHSNILKLTEAPVEISPDYSGSGEELSADFPELSRGKYDLTPEETRQVFSQFLSKFRSVGGNSPKLFKDFFETEIGPVVRVIKPSINNTNSKYTSRVLYNALKAANVLKDERDGAKGIKLLKKPSEKGVETLTKFTLKNAGQLGVEADESKDVSGGEGIDDPVMKAFWERIFGEGEFSREELISMIIDDNEDMDDTDAKINISSLIRTGYLQKTDNVNFKAVDPEEKSEEDAKEGEGTGEITSGLNDDELDEFEDDSWGGVYVGPKRGEGSFD